MPPSRLLDGLAKSFEKSSAYSNPGTLVNCTGEVVPDPWIRLKSRTDQDAPRFVVRNDWLMSQEVKISSGEEGLKEGAKRDPPPPTPTFDQTIGDFDICETEEASTRTQIELNMTKPQKRKLPYLLEALGSRNVRKFRRLMGRSDLVEVGWVVWIESESLGNF